MIRVTDLCPAYVPWAISDHQSHADGAFINPPTVPPDLTVLVYVSICSAMVLQNRIDCVDSGWIRTFHAIEGEIPTFAAPGTMSYSEITIKLHFQGCVLVYFSKDAVLQK